MRLLFLGFAVAALWCLSAGDASAYAGGDRELPPQLLEAPPPDSSRISSASASSSPYEWGANGMSFRQGGDRVGGPPVPGPIRSAASAIGLPPGIEHFPWIAVPLPAPVPLAISIPEPGTTLLFGTGLVALSLSNRRRRRRQVALDRA